MILALDIAMTNDDNKCAKCGSYSGGAMLCRKCEKEAVKKIKKPGKKGSLQK